MIQKNYKPVITTIRVKKCPHCGHCHESLQINKASVPLGINGSYFAICPITPYSVTVPMIPIIEDAEHIRWLSSIGSPNFELIQDTNPSICEQFTDAHKKLEERSPEDYIKWLPCGKRNGNDSSITKELEVDVKALARKHVECCDKAVKLLIEKSGVFSEITDRLDYATMIEIMEEQGYTLQIFCNTIPVWPVESSLISDDVYVLTCNESPIYSVRIIQVADGVSMEVV